ncbi:hypothetical protein BDD12DRAFT_750654, partial [Trichophaea hybrida]
VRSLVYRSLVVQYRIQTAETLNYLADYLEEFHATKDVFKAIRKSRTTRTTFDFVKIHLMLHYEESAQRFGHLVKDSTETQEMNHRRCV